jgi:hypothetical protein
MVERTKCKVHCYITLRDFSFQISLIHRYRSVRLRAIFFRVFRQKSNISGGSKLLVQGCPLIGDMLSQSLFYQLTKQVLPLEILLKIPRKNQCVVTLKKQRVLVLTAIVKKNPRQKISQNHGALVPTQWIFTQQKEETGVYLVQDKNFNKEEFISILESFLAKNILSPL